MRLITFLAASPVADPFWRQALLNAVSPLVAALFGGLVVGLIVQRAQDRRDNITLRNTLSFEMIQVAYSFYRRTQETIRIQRYGGSPDDEDLDEQYLKTRIDGEVLQAKLEVYFPDGEASWLWHGAIDLLGVRYYRAKGGGKPLDDMIKRHAHHPDDEKIPSEVRDRFLNNEQLKDDKLVSDRFGEMLRQAATIVLQRKIPTERMTRSTAKGAT
jgi:hypothetical protein